MTAQDADCRDEGASGEQPPTTRRAQRGSTEAAVRDLTRTRTVESRSLALVDLCPLCSLCTSRRWRESGHPPTEWTGSRRRPGRELTLGLERRRSQGGLLGVGPPSPEWLQTFQGEGLGVLGSTAAWRKSHPASASMTRARTGHAGSSPKKNLSPDVTVRRKVACHNVHDASLPPREVVVFENPTACVCHLVARHPLDLTGSEKDSTMVPVWMLGMRTGEQSFGPQGHRATGPPAMLTVGLRAISPRAPGGPR